MNIFHTDLLNQLNEKLYKDTLTVDNITTNEVSKQFNEETYFGFVLQRENIKRKVKEKFFLETKDIDKLPLMITSKTKFSYKTEVFWFIKSAETVEIPAEKRMGFKELTNKFADYGHSNLKHHMLNKMIILSGYCERLNARLVSESSFGKSSIVNILSLTNGSVSKTEKATYAKLKHTIPHFDFIVCDEVGDLKDQERSDMQAYLFPVGAWEPFYTNPSVSIGKARDKTNLINKTHIILHNTPDYYEEHGQKYFEQLFTPAITDRFPGLLMQGYVTEDFSQSPNIEDLSEKDEQLIKDIIATINYYKENPVKRAKYKFPYDLFNFVGKEKQRSARSFKVICKYLAECSDDEKEFIEWCNVLKKCWMDYKRLLHGERIEEEVVK